MRIAVVAPPWLPVPPPAYGGTEAVVDGLAGGLHAMGHDVLLIAHPDSTCPAPLASVVPAEDCTRMGRAAIELEHAVGAYELAAEYDVVSDHTLGGVIHSAAYPHLPVVATNHNPFSRTRNRIYGALCGRGTVVAISRSHAASTPLRIDAVVHNGVDVDSFPVGAGDGGYLAMLTRMAPDKGVDRAARLARRAGARLLIAAKAREDDEVAYLENSVRPLLGQGVEYLGEIDATAKRELLAGATALLNPIAWDEPFGMAMVEAMACGTPVIATNRGAAPEIVTHGETGYLADTDEDLIAAIDSAAGLDRAACRSRAAKRFSVEAMCASYVEVFEGVTRGRPG